MQKRIIDEINGKLKNSAHNPDVLQGRRLECTFDDKVPSEQLRAFKAIEHQALAGLVAGGVIHNWSVKYSTGGSQTGYSNIIRC